MAITKTTTFNHVCTFPAVDTTEASNNNAAHPEMMVIETITLDDSGDDTLPISQETKRYISKYSDANSTLTDISSENALVKSIAGVIWS
tara:strand:+ start:282 stop:548 length:267 start_codon:yes stop_codon:yes gene_type:complete